MLEQDQMFRSLVLKYAPKLSKKKKPASYMLEKKKQTIELPLEEAIKLKKDATLMADAYDPISVEKYWDLWWNQNKYFHANLNDKTKKKFVMCLPPPNVTGYLHIGHALTNAIQDSIVRRKRMQNYVTLYLPGTDHAGIATQSVVEKQLYKQSGKTRYDLGREEFIKKAWDWKQKSGSMILNQLRRIGASLDWDREFFTMDSNLSDAVTEAFAELFDKKLIYRANRLVNWSCALKTAISDIEVDFQDIEKKTLIEVPGYDKRVQFGVLIYFAYKLKQDPTKEIIVATTRIETMLGDVAVAVNPNDIRYKDLIGKQLIHPFIAERTMKIITDDFVESEFGTGAVKITPAHDPNDYAIGKRHNLQFINIFTEDGNINQNGGQFTGQKRFHCRKVIEEQLKKIGLWRDKKDNKMRLGTCQRSGDVIQPLIKPQWYVNCSEIAQPMIDAVKNGDLKIQPAEEKQTWYRWIGGLRDWCISRQLWWGHRIPAYLAYKKGEPRPEAISTDNWVAARNAEQALKKACSKLNLKPEEIELEQDPDVLDTWFSAGLLPFSALKWPNTEAEDYKNFFPSNLLQTGRDILFFWVAKMVMMSLWLTGKLPFTQVLLHPMVCDSEGNKMSKSRGNVIDPLEIIEGTSLESLIYKIRESNLPKGQQDKSVKKLKHDFAQGISECGSDALRFGLLTYMVQSGSINLNINEIVSKRKFCNKIWNTFKFSMAKFEFIKNFDTSNFDPRKQNFLNSWILGKLNFAIENINKSFEAYSLGEAANTFQNFWWNELCDIYLQATKPLFVDGSAEEKENTALTLFICLEYGIRLLHPMMPFISQELYQKLPQFPGKSQSITLSPYPESFSIRFQGLNEYFKQIQNQFEIVNKFACSLRSIASGVNLPPQIKLDAFIITQQTIIGQQLDLLATLGKCSKIFIIEDQAGTPKGCGIAVIENNKIFLELGSHIDANKELARLNKKLQEIAKFKANLEVKLNAKDRDRIPEKLRQEQDQKMTNFITEEKALFEGVLKIKQLL